MCTWVNVEGLETVTVVFKISTIGGSKAGFGTLTQPQPYILTVNHKYIKDGVLIKGHDDDYWFIHNLNFRLMCFPQTSDND